MLEQVVAVFVILFGVAAIVAIYHAISNKWSAERYIAGLLTICALVAAVIYFLLPTSLR